MRYLVFSLFITVATILLLGVHRYLWKRLVRDTEISGRWRQAATTLLIAGGLLVPLTLGIARRMARTQVDLLALGVFAYMGGLLYLVLFLLAWELPRRRASSKERRVFLARAAAGTALAGTTGVVYMGTGNALGEISTPEIEVPLARLPKALDGLKIVQLTDVHIGPILDKRFLKSVVDKVNHLKPDLVVITGDLVDGAPRVIGPDVAELAGLKSRWGTYFCTGNHEYYSGARQWVDFLDQHGIKTLLNQRVSIGDAGASFDLAGIPDKQGRLLHESHTPNFAKMMDGRDPERELVLLSHRPNPIDEAAKHGVGLQLSGHTHGGQLWPITLATRLIHPYSEGLHLHQDTSWIYVSRGTGFWGPPMRIGAPAEITSLILTSKA
jgi:predicted MPP superfamily phosphohydrolase